jgi:TolB-like protein
MLHRVQRIVMSTTMLCTLAACATTSAGVKRNAPADNVAATQLDRERASANTAGTRPTIAVTPFRVEFRNTNLDALGFAIADLITTDLSRSAQLQLVERARLGDVLREQDFGRSGRVDSATAPKVGKLLRADRLVLGSLDTMPNGELRLGIRVAEVSTGVLQQALDARAPLADILEAEKALVLRLFESLGVALSPAERAAISARRTSNVDALTAYGRGVQAELGGDRQRAEDEYQRSLRLDPAFTPPSERITEMRATAQREQEEAELVPAKRKLGAPVSGTIDRLNRPLDLITSITRPSGGPGDPAFPSTIVTILLRIQRP